jgi:hypothetical protein
MEPFRVYGALYGVWSSLGCMGPFRVYGALKTFHTDVANSFLQQIYNHDEAYYIPVIAYYLPSYVKSTEALG